MMIRWLLLFPLLIVLNGCILVEDFGGYWKKADADPCLDMVVEKEYADSFEDTAPPYPARVLHHDGLTFLLLKESENDKGGHLYPFTIIDNIYIGLRPDPAAYKRFKEAFENPPVEVSEDKAQITELNKETLDFLSMMVRKPDYWQEGVRRMYNSGANKECSLFIPKVEE